MWATTYSGSDQNVGFEEPFLYYASQVLQKTVDGYFHRTKLYPYERNVTISHMPKFGLN